MIGIQWSLVSAYCGKMDAYTLTNSFKERSTWRGRHLSIVPLLSESFVINFIRNWIIENEIGKLKALRWQELTHLMSFVLLPPRNKRSV